MNLSVKKKHGYVRFWTFFALLAAIIFVRYGLQIDIPRSFALIPIVAIAILGNQTEVVAICMCLIPLYESLDFYYALVLVVAIYVIRFYRRIKTNASFFLMLIIVIWELLHCLAADFSPMDFIISLAPIIALTVILCSDFSDLDYGFVVRTVAVAALLTCLTMLVQVAWISRFNLTKFLLNLRRLGSISEAGQDRLQFSGGLVQTNSLGVICVLTAATLIQLRMIGQKRRSDMFAMLTLLIFGTFTASRTFLVCLVLMVLLMLLGQNGGLKKLRYLGMAVLAVALILLFFGLFFPDQLEFYISRFFVADITTGRDDLMVNYHNFIVRNPNVMFFGIGLQDFGDKLMGVYRVANNIPHNSLQEIIVAWGIPGLICVALLILHLIVRARLTHGRRKLVNYIPLVIILFKSIAGQLLTSNYSVLALGFSYLSLIQDLDKDTTVSDQ